MVALKFHRLQSGGHGDRVKQERRGGIEIRDLYDAFVEEAGKQERRGGIEISRRSQARDQAPRSRNAVVALKFGGRERSP